MESFPVKLLLIEAEDSNGLISIRDHMDDLIDLPDGDMLSDATCTSNTTRVIKDDKVYVCIKSYFDLDNNYRIIMAKRELETFDVLNEG